jgi:hypothetical protein
MPEETTIKVDKSIMGKIHGIKGYLNFTEPGTKHRLNDAVRAMAEFYIENHSLTPNRKPKPEQHTVYISKMQVQQMLDCKIQFVERNVKIRDKPCDLKIALSD